MDTCVLMPNELSLVLRADSEVVSDRQARLAESGRGDRRPGLWSPGTPPPRRRSCTLEMGATVWANKKLEAGATFTPDQGSMRLERLEIYRKLCPDDVRYQFGLFDEIHVIDDEEVRHCNWVRFLRSSTNIDEVNMVAVRVKGQTLFQVVTQIPPNGELTVYFDATESAVEAPRDIPSHRERVPTEHLGHAHLTSRTPIRSPGSPRSLSAHSLMTPPSDREDDVRSTVSDVTTTSDDSHQSYSAKSSVSINSSFSSEARTPKTASPSPGRAPLPMETARMMTSPLTMMRSPPGMMTSPPETVRSPADSVTSTTGTLTSPTGTMTSPTGTMTSPTGSISSPQSQFPGKSPEDYMKLPAKRNRERTWLPCEVCGKKFDRPSLLRRHMRTHTGEKPHACDVCGKAFSTSSSLNTHRRIHSGEKPHQCPICGKRFTASSNLYYHRMTHNKDKPHKCTLCSKSFPTPGDLKSHMYVHNGSWPYKCDVCNRGFSKHTNLKNHLLLHTGDKPHECDLCGKRFALQCNLKTHMKTHEGEPQEECFKCGKVFLVSSRQVLNGYCRSCLQTVGSTAHGPAHSAQGPSPGPGSGPGPNPSNRPHSFSVESLATSSIHRPRPVGLTDMGASDGGGTSLADRSSLAMSGYAMFDPKANMVAMAGVPRHPASALLNYPGGLSWPKLVPHHY